MCNDAMQTQFDFSDALLALKRGARLARAGWNGKGQWVQAQYPDEHSKMQLPYLYLHNAHGQLVPWVPSTGDLFAVDWVYAVQSDTFKLSADMISDIPEYARMVKDTLDDRHALREARRKNDN